jgi:asparagine synthetase B (glutamine-hydrolysing)
MSGFFGMLHTDGVAVEQRFLDRVMERLRFRGPDGGQTWTKNGLGSCFAYLETGSRRQSRRTARRSAPGRAKTPHRGAAHLLRLSVSRTEEDWAEGKEEHGSRVWEAIKRPVRLMRKYGQDG